MMFDLRTWALHDMRRPPRRARLRSSGRRSRNGDGQLVGDRGRDLRHDPITMCGRAKLSASPEDLREVFHLDELPQLSPRYNIAPSQPIPIVRSPRRLELLRWGLVLAHAKSHARGINVRVESVARAPAYRDAFRTRRCLVIVDGFYEWKAIDGKRQPYLVRRADSRPFALAGIWDRHVTEDGEVLESCAVLTGPAEGALAAIHDRMPVIVPQAAYARWIDVNVRDVSDLLVTSAADLALDAVSDVVNSPANDDPRCVEPVDPASMTKGNLSLFE
jgi:putative SOS response-associated peptidase YedK